jgi:hypothetical protein
MEYQRHKALSTGQGFSLQIKATGMFKTAFFLTHNRRIKPSKRYNRFSKPL